MMFVLYYELAMRLLSKWHPIAFVDDVVAVTPNAAATVQFIRESREVLQRMGLELNVPKTEVLVVGSATPFPMSIPGVPRVMSGTWMFQPKPVGDQQAPPTQCT